MSGSEPGWGWAAGARLSIDLGTSSTVAVLSVPGRLARVVDVDGASAMPSAVFAAEDGRLVVGREAERLARLAPARFEPNPKRRVDEGELLLGDVVVPVARALAAVIGKVVAEAVRQLGGAWPEEVRLTHPAQWGSARCAVLLEAARLAGVGERVRLVPEPVAAAAQFVAVTGMVLAPGQAVAVYDLGAGTFDVAVVADGPGGFAVLAKSGLADLGGLDLDQALLDHIGRQVGGRDPAAWQRLVEPGSVGERRVARALREDVRIAKEALSEHPQTEVALPEPFGAALVTRVELEELVAPGLRRSVEVLGATASGAGLDVRSLAAVFLVGGSSRVPLVAKLIADTLGIVPTALDQPETAVAFGAQHVVLADGPGTREVPVWPGGPVAYGAPAPRGVGRRAVLVGLFSVLLVAAVVALVVLAPWRSERAASPKPSSGGAAAPPAVDGFQWALTRADVGFFVGMWPLSAGVVLGTDKGLTAYDAESGDELWSWRVPADNFLCNMTDGTANGMGAFTYGPWGEGAQDCHHLQTITLKTGELGWDEPVSMVVDGYAGWLGEIGGSSLSISDTTVTAAYAGKNALAEHSTDLLWADLSSGEVVGTTDFGAEPIRDGCRLSGHAQALRDRVVAVATCQRDPSNTLLVRDVDGTEWLPAGTLDGCGPMSNIRISGFLRAEGEHLLIGCGMASATSQLYVMGEEDYDVDAMDLSGVAVDAMTNYGGGTVPHNLLVVRDQLYLVRGADGTTDGVVAGLLGRGQQWQHVLSGVSSLRLMAATEETVTVLVTNPGPAALHTIEGANRASEGPALDPAAADALPNAEQAVRVGDWLVCGFNGIEDGELVVGAVRVG